MKNDYSASINRVLWSPDGPLFGIYAQTFMNYTVGNYIASGSKKNMCHCFRFLFEHLIRKPDKSDLLFCDISYFSPGIAYSKHIVQIYSYHGGDDLRNHLEVNFFPLGI